MLAKLHAVLINQCRVGLRVLDFQKKCHLFASALCYCYPAQSLTPRTVSQRGVELRALCYSQNPLRLLIRGLSLSSIHKKIPKHLASLSLLWPDGGEVQSSLKSIYKNKKKYLLNTVPLEP